MNPTELLDQFVTEARECLEAIGQRLLDVEREPRNAELLNDLFRSVHTLKGNCGLFDLKALETVVHAGEDTLDRVRHGDLEYGPGLADALLEAMDHTAELIDQIERDGGLPSGVDPTSQRLALALRAFLAPAAADAPAAGTGPAPTGPSEQVAWLASFDAQVLAHHAGAIAVRYVPEAECFFKGEDPWRLVHTVPGLVHLDVSPVTPWPLSQVLDDWDCYRCNLAFHLVSTAGRDAVDAHFRYVPEQTSCAVIAPTPDPAALTAEAGRLWRQQLSLLSRGGSVAGNIESARRALTGLLAAAPLQWPEAGPLPDGDAELVAWARSQSTPDAGESAGPETVRADEAPGERTRVLKVGQAKVDRLMDLIGEMVVAKNALPYLAQRAESQFGQRELAREIKTQYSVINRIAEDMQRAIMEVRMLPVGTIFQRFGRLVRDISRKLGKEVELVLEGQDTEADKNVIEALADPLIHVVRNSLDHGVELPAVRTAQGKPAHGTISIRARQEADRVVIEIADDGAGVNAERVRAKAVERGIVSAERAAALSDDEAVQLVFLPGFSTAESISDLSGRGVGMDVVRTAVERVNGQVTLQSRAGQGTTVRLSLPLSMAVSNVMTIETGGQRFGVPMDMIVETVRLHRDEVHHFKNARTALLRGRVVPLRGLNELLAIDAAEQTNAEGEMAVLVVRLGGDNVGLVVDQFHGATDIILKPLDGVLAGLTGFAGSALMGDGSVLMVLNPKELM